MGVWIETALHKYLYKMGQSHPVWVCGLKHSDVTLLNRLSGHTLYGCVD